MHISLDWIQDFVELNDITPEQIYNKFTLGSAEVEGYEVVGAFLEKIQVVEVVEKNKHPEADKLNLVTFKVSDSESREVVCGAPNVRVGMRTAYAPIGTTLPGGFTLEPKKIRGVLSNGMLCSQVELGLGEDSDGIMDLKDDAKLGMTMLEYLGESKDVVLDVDNKSLTHRPDLWGHYGMAREFATIFRQELKTPYDESWQKKLESHFTADASPMKVKVAEQSAALTYSGLSINNVKIGSSPKWMQKRLTTVGLRPINNIVDISNYVMLELGIPLHIFDRDLIKGDQVHIHELESDSKFTTLDEMERDLIAGDTVISDADKPLVIAGLMGGLNSGVTDDTKNIFIETANWKAAQIRRTSVRLGLRTDASQRYEKSLDSNLCYRTMLRTVELVLESCPDAKVIGKVETDGSFDPNKEEKLSFDISFATICNQLGKQIADAEIVEILERLDFSLEKNGDSYKITVPTYRSTKDIECEADIIEEVGRIVGYDNIEAESPKLAITPTKLSYSTQLERKIKEFMVQHVGALEVMTYPLVGKALLNKVAWPELNEELKLVNALSVEQDRMRPSLLPTFLSSIGLNTKNFSDFSLFEFGRSFSPDSKTFSKEEKHLVCALVSKSENKFLELTNKMEALLSYCNIASDLVPKQEKFPNPVVPYDWQGVHPNEYLNIRIMGKMAGAIFSLHPLLAKDLKIKGNAVIAVVNLTQVLARPAKQKVKYRPLSKFPSSSFDCTVVTAERTPISEVFAALRKIKVKEIVSRKIVGTFNFDENKKSVTVRVVFADPDKTLDGNFLKNAEAQVVKVLEKEGFPLKN